MKYVSTSQSHAAMGVLAQNVLWEALSGDALQKCIDDPQRAGINFTRFLMNGAGVDDPPLSMEVDYTRPLPWAGEVANPILRVAGIEHIDPLTIERVRVSKDILEHSPEYLPDFLFAVYGSRLLDIEVMQSLLAKEYSWLIPASWRNGRTCFPNRLFYEASGALYLPGIAFNNNLHAWTWGGITYKQPRDDFYIALRAKQ